MKETVCTLHNYSSHNCKEAVVRACFHFLVSVCVWGGTCAYMCLYVWGVHVPVCVGVHVPVCVGGTCACMCGGHMCQYMGDTCACVWEGVHVPVCVCGGREVHVPVFGWGVHVPAFVCGVYVGGGGGGGISVFKGVHVHIHVHLHLLSGPNV